MSIFEAIVLGIIQGLTEFLPISSSGHLELAKAIFGDSAVGKESRLMTVVLHFATALSTVVIFRKELRHLFKGLFLFKWNDELRFSLKIIVSMIPAALVGILLKDEIEVLFGGTILLVGSMLIVTGVLLFFADKAKKTEKEVSFFHSALIGISQAIAVLPGISRSGATISTSVLLGVDREKAARFSFLMVVPLIFGVILVDTKDFLDNRKLENTNEADRTVLIIDKLVSDEVLDSLESKLTFSTIFTKELAWSEMKLKGGNDHRELEESYRTNLNQSGLSNQKVDAVMSHDFGQVRSLQGPDFATLSTGFLFAFITGLFACRWMIGLVKNAKLKYFSFYCFGVGLIVILFALI